MDINLLVYRTSLSEGGIQNTGYLLAQEFSKTQGVHLTLFTDEYSEVPKEVDTERIKNTGNWDMKFYLRMLRHFNGHKVGVNLCMYWKCGISCYIRKLFGGGPYAVMVYGNDIMTSQHVTAKSFILEKIRKIVLNHAACIFACSEFTKDLCRQMCGNQNIHVIHPPVQFLPTDTQIQEKNYVLFSIGRHVERKGFQDVISAMPGLRKIYPQIKYRLAGDGPYHEELVKLAKRLGVDDCVEFLGQITDNQKSREFAFCDMLIMTSHEDKANMEVEGFGIVYLEAAAHGKWVIARDSGGVSDAVVNDVTGYLLPDSKADTICKAVDRFYKSCTPDVTKLKRWAEIHSPENIAEQYIEVLKEYA